MLQIVTYIGCMCNKYGIRVDVCVTNSEVQWTSALQIWSEIARAGVQRFTPAGEVAGIWLGRDTGAREEPSAPVILTPGLPVLMISLLHKD